MEMPRKKENFLKCVYKISFINCEKIYVGSSCRWPYRKTEHFNKLSKNKHSNRYLQRAFNKYGLANISIKPLEFIENIDILRNREQYWIDFFDTTNPNRGFNLVKLVDKIGTTGYKFSDEQRSKLSNSSKLRMSHKSERDKISESISKKIQQDANYFNGAFVPEEFQMFSPDGELVKIYNLCKFCREKNLDYKKMYDTAIGVRVEYLGWKKDLKRKNKSKKCFLFTSPQGEIVEIFGLKEFCEKNNLSLSSMYCIHRGIGISCQGWTKFIGDKKVRVRKGKSFKIQNNLGISEEINNLKIFCINNNISYDIIRKGGESGGFKIVF